MFTPPAFRMPDRALRPHAARHDFGLLTIAEADPSAPPSVVQIPMLLVPAAARDVSRDAAARDVSRDAIEGAAPPLLLIGHVARANPIWRLFDGRRKARALFPGPHAYISPAWYAVPDHAAVPTWNYATVEAIGAPRLVDAPDAALRILDALARAQEPAEGGWRPAGAAEATVARMLGGIAAFEMPVETLTGKAKLSQNRSPEDRAGVVAGLRATGSAEASALADLMCALDTAGESA